MAEEERRRKAAVAGHSRDEATARDLFDDRDARVRATALAALVRMGAARPADLARALVDSEAPVRRRACELAASSEVDLAPSLADPEPAVVEAAAWALGERGRRAVGAVEALAGVATTHDDALCREAARRCWPPPGTGPPCAGGR